MSDNIGNKNDIIKHLTARMTGIGIQESIQYFKRIEVSNIILF